VKKIKIGIVLHNYQKRGIYQKNKVAF